MLLALLVLLVLLIVSIFFFFFFFLVTGLQELQKVLISFSFVLLCGVARYGLYDFNPGRYKALFSVWYGRVLIKGHASSFRIAKRYLQHFLLRSRVKQVSRARFSHAVAMHMRFHVLVPPHGGEWLGPQFCFTVVTRLSRTKPRWFSVSLSPGQAKVRPSRVPAPRWPENFRSFHPVDVLHSFRAGSSRLEARIPGRGRAF